MKYFKKLLGDRIYLSPRSIEDAEKFTEWMNDFEALKCYKKCGFKETGRIRENRFINGKYYDTIAMDILENEFSESYIRNKNIK